MTEATIETRIVAVDSIDLPTEMVVREKLEQVAAFQKLIRSTLIEGHDYGVIPGTNKPTLFKAGAEKTTKLLGLADTYTILEKSQDWDKPLFAYEIKCQLVSLATGQVVTEGLGECNSYEAKYRWRQGERTCPECHREGSIIKGKREFGGGWLCWQKKEGCGAKWPDGAQVIESQVVERIPNPDIYDQVNTLLKMAKKRALVDAALSVGRLSDLFTQDMEDIPKQSDAPKANTQPAAKPRQKATKAPESPVEAPKSPEPPPTAGKAIKVPNQVAVGEKMNGIEFVHASNQCGWDGDIVAKYLGSQSVTEWSEKNSHGDNYRPAWDFCVAAWKTQQIEELPW